MARTLSPKAIKEIHDQVAKVFERARTRFLGLPPRQPKTIAIGPFARPLEHRPDRSLPGIFDQAAHSEGGKPNQEMRGVLDKVVQGYLDTYHEKAKHQVVNTINNYLMDSDKKNLDHTKILGGELAEVMSNIIHDVRRMASTEATRAQNTGAIDPALKQGIVLEQNDDPTVVFLGPWDTKSCSECRRMFLLNGVPRCWKLSECRNAHFKKGDETPSLGGTHPNCRHVLTRLSKGYGFNENGKLKFISLDHDELSAQRS